MAKNKLGIMALAALLLGALLAFFLAARYGARPGGAPDAPAAPAAGIAAGAPGNAPAAGAPRKKKSRRRKPEKIRVGRVSELQDPGEALISGIGRDTVPAAGTPAETR